MNAAVSRMALEIAQQSDVVAGLLARRAPIQRSARALLGNVRGVVLVGRGSSENAAWFGRQVLQNALGCPAVVADAEDVIASGNAFDDFAVIGISQSGQTQAVVEAVSFMARRPAPAIAITNAPDSALGAAADLVVDLGAGFELAVPATKTFTGALTALLVLADEFAPMPLLGALPGALAVVIGKGHRALAASAPVADLDGWACIGAGLLEPIAREAALKLEESALVVADHHDPASFHHGPLATVGPRRPALVFAAHVGDHAWRLGSELRDAGSPVVLVAPSVDADLPLPVVPQPLVTVVAAVRAQQFALALATRRGLNPDHPPHLTKVTMA